MHDCDVAMAVAEAGAAVVRRYFGTTLQRLEKDAGDFATNVDIEAEHAMLAVLHRERPKMPCSARRAAAVGHTAARVRG